MIMNMFKELRRRWRQSHPTEEELSIRAERELEDLIDEATAIDIDDYLRRGGRYEHDGERIVPEVGYLREKGKTLYAKGGVNLMLLVYHRVKRRKTDTSQLDREWRGIGRWRK